MKTKKRVVIIGKGFIAEAVEQLLLKKKINVLSFTSKTLNLLKTSSQDKLKKIVKNKDCVLFSSAIAPVKSYDMLVANLQMLHNFCLGISENSVSKIIYLSSDAVYSDTYKKINEKSETNPESLHGFMHLLRENYLKSKFKNKICIIRPTLVYGYKDPHNGYGPNKFVREIKKKNTISIYGKGEERRDHIYLNDLANLISNLIINNHKGIFNFATGRVISFLSMAKKISSINKSKLTKIVYMRRSGPMPHNGYRAFDISKLKKNFINFRFGSFENNLKKDFFFYK